MFPAHRPRPPAETTDRPAEAEPCRAARDTRGMASSLFAHSGQFTWDEALMVLVPIALVAGVLILANQRAKKIQAERAAGGSTTTGAPDGPDEATADVDVDDDEEARVDPT